MSQKELLKDKHIIADFLSISIRTLNRYVQKYNLSVYSHRNHKKLSLKEVLLKINNGDLNQFGTSWDSFGQFEKKYVKKTSKKRFKKAIGTVRDKLGQVGTEGNNTVLERQKVSKYNSGNENSINFSLSSLQQTEKEAEIYKNLYKETLFELKVKQERLEGATYRVGQLEAQIKSSVPLLSYRQKEEEVIQLHEIQKIEKQKQEKKVKQLEKEKQEEQIVKNVYVVTLFTFLILIPFILIYLLNK